MSNPQDERFMWACVVRRMFLDACANATPRTPLTIRQEHDRTAARAWLRGDNPDFTLVCDFAGMDPAMVRSRADRMRARGWPTLADDYEDHAAERVAA